MTLIHRPGSAVMAAAMLLAVGSTAFAQSATDSDQPPSGHQSESATVKQLKKRLDERDAVIRDLVRRTERLERLYQQRNAASAPAAASVAAAFNRAGSGNAPSGLPVAMAQGPVAASAQVASADPGTTPVAASEPGAPGQFTVSPEASEHALERALVQTGALLLPAGKVEFVPSVTYQYDQLSRPDQIVLTTAGTLLASEDVLHSTLLQTGALLRVGLPWDSQLEIGTSFDYANLMTSSQVPGSYIGSRSVEGSGLGDTNITLIKQVAKEGSWLPNVFISGTANMGQMDDGLPLGNGYNWLRGSVLAVKRQDPLVFTAGLSYQANFESHGITPGGEIIPAVGMLFAVSPETSLQFTQEVAFIQDTRLHGTTIPGSSQLQGIFQAGVLSILAPGLVVNLAAAVGETPDAPNLTLEVSFPIRLN